MKYNLNDTVYYIRYGKIHSGKIIARAFSEKLTNLDFLKVSEYEWLSHDFPFQQVYAVFDSIDLSWNNYSILDLFSSKEELINFISE